MGGHLDALSVAREIEAMEWDENREIIVQVDSGEDSHSNVTISDTTDPTGMAARLFSNELHIAKTLTKNPAYYYAHVATYPGGESALCMSLTRPGLLGLICLTHLARINTSILKFTKRRLPCQNFSGKRCTCNP